MGKLKNIQEHTDKKILLMGLPNVGKSAIFSRYTGMDVMVSNYSGTTVEYTEGRIVVAERAYTLVDVPGVYDIKDSIDDAERVAISMLNEKPEAILFVLDALNLESSLHLLMQVLAYNIPTIVALNRTDLLKGKGMTIDHRVISARLNVPVFPTVALEKKSLQALRDELHNVMENKTVNHNLQKTEEDRWKDIERIVERSVKKTIDPNTYQGKYAFLIKPMPGIPIAIVVLAALFAFVIGFGMGLRQFILLPILRGFLFPAIEQGVFTLFDSELVRGILVGEYGFLIKGIEWPFALVLPYVISFYTMMSILEDTGYLPRLAVLLDGIFKKIGLSGSSIIPIMLGYGCGIPAIMSTRSMRSKKSRLTIAVMVSLAVPCVSQSGAFVALLIEHSLLALVFVFLMSFVAMMIVGIVMKRLNKEAMPFTLLELPELLLPKPKLLTKKIYMRIKHYIKDGAIPMILAIMVTAMLYEIGVLDVMGRGLAPLVSGWLRLPEAAATPLIIGIVRRELAVLPLIDMDLTTVQFFTGATVALFYVPCIAMIATLAKEFNAKVAVFVLLLTTTTAIFLGGVVARVGELLVQMLG